MRQHSIVTRPAIAYIVFVALAAVGCDSNKNLSGPTTVSLTGGWSGTMSDNTAGSGSLTLDLQPYLPGGSGAVVKGSWSAALGSNAPMQGAAEGTLTVYSSTQALLIANCSFAPPVGGLAATLSLSATVTDRRMTGTYQSLGCGGLTSGSFDLTR